MLTATEQHLLNRQSAQTMTELLRQKFGPDYVAYAWRGRRQIGRTVSPMCLESVTAPTWVMALRLAKEKFNWKEET